MDGDFGLYSKTGGRFVSHGLRSYRRDEDYPYLLDPSTLMMGTNTKSALIVWKNPHACTALFQVGYYEYEAGLGCL
jgi:hypothetical protein